MGLLEGWLGGLEALMLLVEVTGFSVTLGDCCLNVGDGECGVVECVVEAVVVVRAGIEEAVDGGVVVAVSEVTQVAQRLDCLGERLVCEREARQGTVAFSGFA